MLITHFKRLGFALALVLVALIAITPLGQAQTNVSPAQAQARADAQVRGPDASTPAALERIGGTAERAELVSELQAIRPFLSVARDGSITLRADYSPRAGEPDFAPTFARINAGIKAYEAQQAQQAGVSFLPRWTIQAAAWWWCGYIPNWALDAYAWYIIISGGAWAIIGAFVDITVIGIPLGAVLNALGIGLGLTGAALLWYFDKYYPNGVWLCLWR